MSYVSSYTVVQTTSSSSAAQILFPVLLIGSLNIRDPCVSKLQSSEDYHQIKDSREAAKVSIKTQRVGNEVISDIFIFVPIFIVYIFLD